jgi:hypothetical protein
MPPIEWVQAHKVDPYLRGPYQSLVSENMVGLWDQINQTSSYAYYQRYAFEWVGAHTIMFHVQLDFWYFLHHFRASWPPAEQKITDLRFKLYEEARNRCATPEIQAVPFRLVSTPNAQQLRLFAVDQSYMFQPRSDIRLDVFGYDGADPAYVDIVLEGERIPKEYAVSS